MMSLNEIILINRGHIKHIQLEILKKNCGHFVLCWGWLQLKFAELLKYCLSYYGPS